MSITKTSFGKTENGEPVSLFTITNNNKMTVQITDLGASIVSATVPDKDGNIIDVILGYKNAENYLANRCYMGAVVGRNANRIFPAHVELDGKIYELTKNNGENNLHSGNKGTNKKVFSTEIDESSNSLNLNIRIKHLEDDFPGNFDLTVKYTLTEDNTLELEYRAKSDMDTIANVTNHTYFNLSGHESGTVLDHIVEFDSSFFMPNSPSAVPTGEIISVEGTPFDLRSPISVKDAISKKSEYLNPDVGFDNNLILNGNGYRKICEIFSPATSVHLEAFTTEPCIQFYIGSNIVSEPLGKENTAYKKFDGLCLETQHSPNTPNQPWLKPTLLKADNTWNSKTAYKFSVK